MRKLVLLSAVTFILCACTPKEEPCDPTSARYTKMMKEGTPLTEKDKACVQANLIRGLEEGQKKMMADLEKQRAEEKAHPYKPIDWGKTLFPKK